jgi:hypothetical protein
MAQSVFEVGSTSRRAGWRGKSRLALHRSLVVDVNTLPYLKLRW